MVKQINQRVEGTNLFVYSHKPETGIFAYFRPFSVDEARALAADTNKSIRDYGVKGLKGSELYADEDTGELVRVSTLREILANRTLMHQANGKKWLPTISEGLELQKAGLYRPGILINHGIALYSADASDEEIAKTLVATAEKQGYTLPVLAPFKSLGLKAGGARYGVTPEIVSPEGLIQGRDAERMLRGNFRWVGNSGVHRLDRVGVGVWDADWDNDLDYFSEVCRVVGFSAEGSVQNLRDIIQGEIKSNYDSQRRKLEAELNELSAREKSTIESAEKALHA